MKKLFVGAEFKALILLALPILCTQLLQVGMGTTDIAITGHFDARVQSGVAMGVFVWNPILLFASGTLMAVTILTAHQFGANRMKRIPTIFHGGVSVALVFSVIAIAIMWNSEYILRFFEVQDDVIPLSVDYLRALSVGVPAIFLFNTLRCICEGVARPVPVTIVTFIGFMINGVMNYFLVYGYEPIGLKSYGVIGSGLGTAFAMWSMLVSMLLFYRVEPRLKTLNLFHYRARIFKQVKGLLQVGVPNGASIFAEVALFSVSGLILGRFGEIVINSHQIALNITSLTFMVPLSTSFALIALIGQRMGRKDYEGAMRIAKMGRLTCFGIMIGTGIYLFALKSYLPMVFTDDPEILKLSAHLLIFSIIFQLPDGLQIAAAGCLRGMKDTKAPMMIGITSYWLVALPIGYYLAVAKNMQAEGVWIGLIVGLTCSAILSNLRLQWQFKRMKHLYGLT